VVAFNFEDFADIEILAARQNSATGVLLHVGLHGMVGSNQGGHQGTSSASSPGSSQLQFINTFLYMTMLP